MKRLILILSLATIVLSSSAKNAVLPQATAARFCQLLVCDNDEQLLSLTSFLRKNPLEANDSLTTEQLFCDYIFHYGGWQTLRIFPYCDGKQAHWFADTSELPEEMPEEHRRYIQEVLLRMQSEVDAVAERSRRTKEDADKKAEIAEEKAKAERERRAKWRRKGEESLI